MENIGFETYQTYDIAEKGTYFCIQCGSQDKENLFIIKKQGMLPECKCCGYTTWAKLISK